MAFKRELESHLRQWKAHLVKVQSAKQMWIPDRFAVEEIGAGEQRFTLPEPICLAALPLGNANGRKERRIWAFIEGFFEVQEVEGEEHLRHFGASVVFLEAKSRKVRRFRLVDAYHFDFHVQAHYGSSPHPLYHSQRALRWDTQRYEKSLNAGQFEAFASYAFPKLHEGIRNNLFRLTRVRIPTARLDLFGLILATTADMLIQHDVEEHRKIFDALMDLIDRNTSPMAKLKRDEPYLPGCYPNNRASVSAWYPLFAKLPPPPPPR